MSALTRSLTTVGGFLLEGDWNSDTTALRVPVESEAIAEISYRRGTITVVFNRGGAGEYDYPGDFELFKRFVNSPSKGAFFNAYIRPLG
jgi:hypothetical protein